MPPGPTTITNIASYADPSSVVISSTTPAVSTVPATTSGVTVTKDDGQTQILSDSATTYTLNVCPESGKSHFAGGYVLSDDVETNAVIVSASGGTVTGNHVEWTLADANDPGFDSSTGCFSRTITVQYPVADFPVSTSVTNTASVDPLSYTGAGGPVDPAPIGPVTDVDTIRDPVPNVKVAKSTNAGYYVKDEDSITYSVNISNVTPGNAPGETALKDVVITDGPLPLGFELSGPDPG